MEKKTFPSVSLLTDNKAWNRRPVADRRWGSRGRKRTPAELSGKSLVPVSTPAKTWELGVCGEKEVLVFPRCQSLGQEIRPVQREERPVGVHCGGGSRDEQASLGFIWFMAGIQWKRLSRRLRWPHLLKDISSRAMEKRERKRQSWKQWWLMAGRHWRDACQRWSKDRAQIQFGRITGLASDKGLSLTHKRYRLLSFQAVCSRPVKVVSLLSV